MAERGQGKNPAPKKKTNKTSTASSKGSKTSSKKTSATTNKATSKKQERDKTPFYILAIMILLCIIFIIINSFDFDKTSNKSNKIEKKVSNIPHKELNEFDSYTDNPVDDNDIHDRIKDEFADETYKKNNETNQLSEIDANIYFVKYNEENDAMSLVPVTRRIKSKTPLRQSLNELLDGPDDVDKTKGLLTAIPDNLLINNINIKNRRAEIDFNTAIEENANGDILLMRIDQIVFTATQFKGIDEVLIKVDGKKKKYLGGEGLSIDKPMRRRGR